MVLRVRGEAVIESCCQGSAVKDSARERAGVRNTAHLPAPRKPPSINTHRCGDQAATPQQRPISGESTQRGVESDGDGERGRRPYPFLDLLFLLLLSSLVLLFLLHLELQFLYEMCYINKVLLTYFYEVRVKMRLRNHRRERKSE